MTDPAAIAAKLTEAQREAIVTRPRSCDVWGDPDRYCVIDRLATLGALYGRGLVELGASDTRLALSDLGLAVRRILEGQGE